MKQTRIIPILAAMLLLLCGCGPKEKTPDEIFQDQASGVVLVLNEYYYSVEFNDGSTIYFSGMKDGELEDVSQDEDSIKKSMAFGTAFFVDDKGTLMTNRHVVDPAVEPGEVKNYVRSLIRQLTAYASYAQEKMADEYSELEDQIEANTYVAYDEYYGYYTAESDENENLRARQRELSNQYDELQEYIEELREIDVSDVNIKTHSKLSVAYNGSYVTGPEDFKPCVIIKESSKEDVDLALIRLKDKKTPSDAYIFAPPKDEGFLGASLEEREKLELNQTLVLIGYNHGIELAATREGIKAQLTTGNVSQQPDDDRVMYTIPILRGSSGSPVLNKWGELVAVNFAGMNDTQSFNFGIPLKRIKQFMKE